MPPGRRDSPGCCSPPPPCWSLAAVCFARLVAEPAGLIVDGRTAQRRPREPGRPAARRQRPDLPVPPASLVDRRADRASSATGRSGTRADSAGGPWSATRRPGCSIRPSGSPGGCERRGAGLADGRPSALGRARRLRAGAVDRARAAGRRRSRRASTRLRRISWPTRSRAIIRTSGRPAGIPGRSGPIAQIATAGRAGSCSSRSWR